MGDRPPTRHSRLSVGMLDSARSIVDQDAGDTGEVFSVLGGYTLTGDGTLTGALTATTLAVGGGTAMNNISLTAATLNFGNLGVSGGVSTLTVGISGATYEDLYVVTTPSIWSGLDDTFTVVARSGDTTGEVDVICVNSGLSARDATEGTFVVMRVGF